MILGRVIGEVWATRKHPRFEGRKVLLVAELLRRDDGHAPTGRVVVATDRIGAQIGHTVTVSWGSGARAVYQEPDNRDVLVDAAINRIVDATSREIGGTEVEIAED